MQSNKSPANPRHVKGWILDTYPASQGEIAVWIITETGQRIRLTDVFKPKIYVSGKEEALERLASQLYRDSAVVSWDFVQRLANATDTEESRILEVQIEDCRMIPAFTHRILRLGKYLQYQVYNCDLRHEQIYFYSHDIFPLALVDIEEESTGLKYNLLDSTDSTDYAIPPLRLMRLDVEVAKKGKIAKINDPIDKITVTQDDNKTTIDAPEEKDKLLHLVQVVEELDPDIILTRGGDSHVFPYLVRRAQINGVLESLVLSRDPIPLVTGNVRGRTFFSYGRTFYRAPTRRLYGRIHIDERNTFILNEAGLDGLIEIARTCRVPLHTAARSSIGSSMSSLEYYQAIKNNILIPRNKSIPEAFKSAYELLVGDRGGFVYEPEIGIHDDVVEVDFVSTYPTLMVKNNISAETVLCKCCPDSPLRIPDLGYHICQKRVGIVPMALKPIIRKRLLYKKLRDETQDQRLKLFYDHCQTALKWILVTCFGYMGYRNAKFGTVDGHIGACSFSRENLLITSRTAEERGFRIVHGIVDSLWLKKETATTEEYVELCKEITEKTGVPLNFEGRYKWIAFLPSRIHPRVGVLNRYFGVMENDKIKVRGLEIRRRDTPQFICDAQTRMLEALAEANNSAEFSQKIPTVLKIVREYREKLLAGEIPIWDLIITKHLSKNPKKYKQKVSQVIAAEQLMKQGLEVSAGKNLKFLFTSAENEHYERRVKAEELIEKDTNPDIKKYLILLYAAAASLLSPLNYTTNKIYDAVRGHRQTTLP